MLADIVSQFPRRRVLVIGDLIADEFVFGEIARVSREAPVMILRHERTETMPGGAGNAAANVAALADNAAVIGIIGRDRAGRQLTLGLRARAVATAGIIKLADYSTPTKTRILAGSVHSTRQQVIRIDRDPQRSPTSDPALLCAQLVEKLKFELARADAVIISDYNYGVISVELLDAVRKLIEQRAIPVVVDSRYRLNACRGFTAATPNQAEMEALVGNRLDTDLEIFSTGARLREELGLRVLLLTRGSDGMVLFESGREAFPLAAVGSKEPVDVTGAGDTVIAAFTLALAGGASYQDAARIANHAGGIVVMKRGTATVSRQELLAALA
jgi:rfaE bifunctional protein kinase chain/domain